MKRLLACTAALLLGACTTVHSQRVDMKRPDLTDRILHSTDHSVTIVLKGSHEKARLLDADASEGLVCGHLSGETRQCWPVDAIDTVYVNGETFSLTHTAGAILLVPVAAAACIPLFLYCLAATQ